MFSFHQVPLINKPTRITANSITLIDNIFTNKIDSNYFQGIFYTDISDHFPIFCINKNVPVKFKEHTAPKRDLSDKNVNAFIQNLQNTDWNKILGINDAQQSYSLFQKEFSTQYEKSFPIKLRKTSVYHNRKPWLTIGLRSAIKRKNKLYLLYKRHPNVNNEIIYKTYKNKLSKLISVAERQHYDALLKKHKSNIKESWKIVNEILGRNNLVKSSGKFIVNDKEIDDPKEIANAFNDFYVNIGSSLAKNIPKIDIKPTSYIRPEQHVVSSFFFAPITRSEVENVICDLKVAAAGYDSISTNIIKKTFKYFIEPLVHCIQLSFNEGTVPEELKIAKVAPVYKGRESYLLENYRPVSILPAFSKIFEKLMNKRLVDYLDKNKVLYEYQFGFRKMYSTSNAVITLVDKISNALNNGNFMLGVFLDFSKAFDTVNHKILCDKLETYGIRGTCLKWFKSYLSNRSQFVMYNNSSSSTSEIVCGVPQGSILGPLLFLIYINDIVNVSHILLPVLFADDTNVFLEGSNINDMCDVMNSELEKLHIWLMLIYCP